MPTSEALVELLTEINCIDDVAVTTNGSLLARKARSLRDAGLSRVTISLDSLAQQTFRAMSVLARVIGGIAAAADAGLTRVKLNTVVKRRLNDGQGIL